jgi:hypothetical protein
VFERWRPIRQRYEGIPTKTVKMAVLEVDYFIFKR